MKQIKTRSGDILCVEVPINIDLDTLSYSTSQDLHLLTTDGKDVDIYCNNTPDVKILGKLSELDKELDEFVDRNVIAKGEEIDGFVLKEDFIMGWKNYINNKTVQPYEFDTPKQSFISLVKSQHPEFQGDKEWLVIKLL